MSDLEHLQTRRRLRLCRIVIAAAGHELASLGLQLRPAQPIPHPVHARQGAKAGGRGHALLRKEPRHRHIYANRGGQRRRRPERLEHAQRDAIRRCSVTPRQLVIANRQLAEFGAPFLQASFGHELPLVINRTPALGAAGWRRHAYLFPGEENVAGVRGQGTGNGAGPDLGIGLGSRAPQQGQDSSHHPDSSHHTSTLRSRPEITPKPGLHQVGIRLAAGFVAGSRLGAGQGAAQVFEDRDLLPNLAREARR